MLKKIKDWFWSSLRKPDPYYTVKTQYVRNSETGSLYLTVFKSRNSQRERIGLKFANSPDFVVYFERKVLTALIGALQELDRETLREFYQRLYENVIRESNQFDGPLDLSTEEAIFLNTFGMTKEQLEILDQNILKAYEP